MPPIRVDLRIFNANRSVTRQMWQFSKALRRVVQGYLNGEPVGVIDRPQLAALRLILLNWYKPRAGRVYFGSFTIKSVNERFVSVRCDRWRPTLDQ